MFFKAVLKPKNGDVAVAMDKLLQAKLKPPMNYRLGHYFRVMIDVPDCGSPAKTRDECFKTAEWARHNNGVSADIPYTVIGYDDELRIIYDSGCPVCKAKDPRPHYDGHES